VADDRGAIDAFLRELAAARDASSEGASIEFVLRQMDERHARVLRRAAIPHDFDEAIIAVLDPEADAASSARQLARLAMVVATGTGRLRLHDHARKHLFSWWLVPAQQQQFTLLSTRLIEHFEAAERQAVGAEAIYLRHQRIFHQIGADPESGFATFETALVAARRDYMLADAQALVALVREYEPILDPSLAWRLDLHQADLLADRRAWDEGVSLLQNLLERAAQLGDETAVLVRLGRCHVERRLWQAALDAYDAALKLAREQADSPHRQRIYEGLAIVQRELHDTTAAYEMAEQAIREAEAAGDPDGLATAHNLMGTIHWASGDLEEAIRAFETSLDYLDKAGRPWRRAQVENNLGLAHADAGEWELSRRHLERSLEVETARGNSLGRAKVLNNLQRPLVMLGELDLAAATADEAAQSFAKLRDWHQAAAVMRDKARFLRRADSTEAARDSFNRAIGYAREGRDADAAEMLMQERDRGGTLSGARTLVAVGLIILAAGFMGAVAVGFVAAMLADPEASAERRLLRAEQPLTAQLPALRPGAPVRAALSAGDEAQWWRIVLDQPDAYAIQASAIDDVDPVILLVSADGTRFIDDDGGDGLDARLVVFLPAGEHLLAVAEVSGLSGLVQLTVESMTPK
jgi:tetratricopeptide (TPR) repeat protein